MDLYAFRRAKDDFFRTDPQSPLSPEQVTGFEGLRYFPDNPRLRLRLAPESPRDAGEVRMPTTTGGEQVYRRFGVVRFEVDGEPADLTLFASADHPGLFLPFRDATSGDETYPGGRYLDLDPPGSDGLVEVDFNHAYNPYCAYNEAWSCPLPPPENWLSVPIRAGEMDFKEPERD